MTHINIHERRVFSVSAPEEPEARVSYHTQKWVLGRTRSQGWKWVPCEEYIPREPHAQHYDCTSPKRHAYWGRDITPVEK